MLSEMEKNKWKEDGFLKLEGFFDTNSIKKISDSIDEISNWGVSEDKWMMWFEKTSDNKKILSRVENFLDYHQKLNSLLFSDSRIENYLQSILNEKAALLKERIIYKYPDSAGYRPHQDIYSVPYNLPNRQVHAIVAIAIDDSTEDNGCIYLSKGNHKNGMLEMDEDGVLKPEVYQNFKWEPIICNPGDVLIFDNYVPHCSKPNKSNQSRRSIYLVYQRASTEGLSRKTYYPKKRAYFSPEGKETSADNLKKQNNIVYRD